MFKCNEKTVLVVSCSLCLSLMNSRLYVFSFDFCRMSYVHIIIQTERKQQEILVFLLSE